MRAIDDPGRRFVDADGVRFRVEPFAQQRDDGIWVGWIEFLPLDGAGEPLRTPAETLQPTCEEVSVWASQLDAAQLTAALEHARQRIYPERAPLPRQRCIRGEPTRLAAG